VKKDFSGVKISYNRFWKHLFSKKI